MINRRFLNYKQYQSFTRDLKAGQILRDAIVFIQDESHPCIWTHGKEYLCNSGKSSISGNSLVFDDGFGNSAFTITFSGSKITVTDSKGNTIEKTYLLKSEYEVDDELNSSSKNPVQNKVIVKALKDKQDKLSAGDGINITNNIISSTLDVEPFVILSQSEFPPQNPSSNKIYIVIQDVGDGTYDYIQYIYRNGQWIATENTTPQFDLSGFLTKVEAQLIYQPIGDYITQTELEVYLRDNILPLFEDYLTIANAEEIYQPKGDYATKNWALETFVRRPEVYTPEQGDLGTNEESDGQPSSGGEGYVSIIIDTALNHGSTNPVENRVITKALDGKVSLTYLETNYVTKTALDKAIKNADLDNYIKTIDFNHALALKQNVLSTGRGISIIDDVISCTLDTDVFVIVESLPIIPDINKIYLLQTENNGVYTYSEYKWDGTQWHNNGQRDPNIHLEDYLKSSVAEETYQRKGSYALTTDLNDYVTSIDHELDLSNLQTSIETTLQNYLTTDEVTSLIDAAKSWVTEYFVKKVDVYTPTDTEADGDDNPIPTPTPNPGEDPIPSYQEVDHSLSTTSRNPVENRTITAALNTKQDILTAGSGITISNNTVSCTINHVFLEQEEYDALSSYDRNTIYFIYEESDEQGGVWHFNDQFPIILTGEWTFGGTFPIILE